VTGPRPRSSAHRGGRPGDGAALVAGTRLLPLVLCTAIVLTGCQQGGVTEARTTQPATRATTPAEPQPVALGEAQDIQVANAFGPASSGSAVPARVTVLAVRDHVAPTVKPRSPASHWTSARVQVCRSVPVVLGYPAWVLGDDDGRTAQLSRALHRQFPKPTFDNTSTATGCQQGWVTFVTSDDLKPTKVTFEQTREVRGPWLILR
jgi:hypothetical protein